MIANYASSVDFSAKKPGMGTWEKVVFGVVFFFSVGVAAAAALAVAAAELAGAGG